jgi:hypothetical protein
MSYSSEIAEAIRRLSKTNVVIQSVLCKVVSVNKAEGFIVADPLNGDADFEDARLRAVMDGQLAGLMIYPVVGSNVIVTIIDNDLATAFVSQYSEIEELLLEIQTGSKLKFKPNGDVDLECSRVNVKASTRINIDSPRTVINGGGFQGLIKIQALVGRINLLEGMVNALIADYNTHGHVWPGPTPPLTTPPLTPFPTIITPTTSVQMIENPKITHG